jgi:hypothetical protein
MGRKNSKHLGVFSAKEELITIRRIDRQTSPNVRSKMRTSHDRVITGGFMDFMIGALSCSTTSTEVLNMTLSEN